MKRFDEKRSDRNHGSYNFQNKPLLRVSSTFLNMPFIAPCRRANDDFLCATTGSPVASSSGSLALLSADTWAPRRRAQSEGGQRFSLPHPGPRTWRSLWVAGYGQREIEQWRGCAERAAAAESEKRDVRVTGRGEGTTRLHAQ